MRQNLIYTAALAILFAPFVAKGEPAAAKNEIGIIPNISEHYSATPSQYNFENMPIEVVSDTISRQYIYSPQSTLVKWILKKGAHIPLHHHVNEQVTWITSGSVRVLSQGKEFIVKAGGVLVIPANVPHEFFALEDTIDIDFFTPARQDWIDGKAEYLKDSSTKK